ncbi:uncharacterized protein LOC119838558 [Zerene cesonia]|uniref:uncharacterized protein LOC119838558 n=1 Tax=Zerene cesonia TaxID=33412 RepID=UPI0018E5A208|nr:uncharacterized protein LOC119838558 [Zerene cesonia]
MEINYEIAKALGILIDRLHDDEKYPSFLDEMLEFIDRLLLNVYNGDFSDVLILLKKHTTQMSQTSQQSQDEKILKRSTLTEIWRKKWNLTKAEVYHKHERRDVIVMCSDVLNKIIVRSMEGYSLVAFAALQCFNLLQS